MALVQMLSIGGRGARWSGGVAAVSAIGGGGSAGLGMVGGGRIAAGTGGAAGAASGGEGSAVEGSGGTAKTEAFWALKDVGFEVSPGDRLGIA